MGPTDFAVACREQRDLMLANYAEASGGSEVATLLAAANLSQEQRNYVVSALDNALTDAFYTMLFAIDGSASLGQTQKSFVLTDGEGNMIANGDGRLEEAAWEALASNR